MRPDRLTIAIASALLLAAGCGQAPAPAEPPAEAPAVQQASAQAGIERSVDEAFLGAFARFEQSRSRFGATQHPLNPERTRVNEAFTHRRTLIGAADRQVTTPNNDTLYSAGWAELSKGPVQVQLPAMPEGRYWSLAVLDIDTDNIAVLGSGSATATPMRLVLAPPGWSGELPADATRVDVPGNDAQVLIRILVDGEDDAQAVHALQAGITMAPLDGSQPDPVPQIVEPVTARDPANFLAVVNESLARNPPVASRRARWESWRAVGIGADAPPFEALPAEVQAAWKARIGALNDSLREGLGRGAKRVGGWRLPDPDVGRFGDDDGLRAAVGYGALGALPSTEAIYLQLDSDPATGKPLDGRVAWILDVPALDVRGFWSLSMYELDEEGRMYFSENAIHRYAIGDRTRGLVRDDSGRLRLQLQHAAPADGSNWLPTPNGPFAIVLRAYLPSDAMRDGSAPLPTLERGE